MSTISPVASVVNRVRSLVSVGSDTTQAGVARRGAARGEAEPVADTWPRPVTRGQLLQDGEASPAVLSTTGLVDWYAFTIPCEHPIVPSMLAQDVLGWLPAAVSYLERGMMGYTEGMTLPGEGKILWNDARPDMGVHVEMPSKCLKLIEVDVKDLAGWVHLRGGKATRVDVAIDTDMVTMEEIVACQESGALVSRATERRLIYNYRDASQTLYVGSPNSRRLVRFYDKAKEQEVDGIWTRCEVQFRRDQADIASQYIALDVSLVDVVVSCVDFRANWQDSNISRCDRLLWWEAWVGQAERVSFATGAVVVDTIKAAFDWVEKQCAPTVAFLRKALGPQAMEMVFDSAVKRIPDYRLRVLQLQAIT